MVLVVIDGDFQGNTSNPDAKPLCFHTNNKIIKYIPEDWTWNQKNTNPWKTRGETVGKSWFWASIPTLRSKRALGNSFQLPRQLWGKHPTTMPRFHQPNWYQSVNLPFLKSAPTSQKALKAIHFCVILNPTKPTTYSNSLDSLVTGLMLPTCTKHTQRTHRIPLRPLPFKTNHGNIRPVPRWAASRHSDVRYNGESVGGQMPVAKVLGSRYLGWTTHLKQHGGRSNATY